MKDIALVDYQSLQEILDDAGLVSHKHMIQSAYQLGFREGMDNKHRRDQNVLDAVSSFMAANGYAPTLKEIAKAIHAKSITTVQRQLVMLEKAGLVTRNKYQKRAWRVK